MTDGRSTQTKNQPSALDQTKILDELLSAATTWPEEVFLSEPQVPKPRNLESNVEFLFADFLDRNKKTKHQVKADGDDHSPDSCAPTSVHIDKVFIPSDPSEPNGENIKPSTAVDVNVSPIKQVRELKIPKDVQVFPAPSRPISGFQNPCSAKNIFSGCRSQVNPTGHHYGRTLDGQRTLYNPNDAHLVLFPSQYGIIPQRRYFTPQVKYVQPQQRHPDVGLYGQFIPALVEWPNVPMVPIMSSLLSSYPDTFPVQHGFPSFHYPKPDASTNNYIMGNVMQMGHNDFSSSNPHQYSVRRQSAPDASPHLAANDDNDYNLADVEISLPERHTDYFTPLNTELFVDVS